MLFIITDTFFTFTHLWHRDDVSSLNLDFPFGKMPSNFSRKILQHYYAATTYVDSLIGDVLDELSKSGLEQNTIITLLSDHGWSLGI